mmetsp:Transcript_18160/g.61763  ORF Transcript_18160/g.61763 Transcript_18160/m.61763 type:complete len:628 (-) Transcript_18160:862-2745(-)
MSGAFASMDGVEIGMGGGGGSSFGKPKQSCASRCVVLSLCFSVMVNVILVALIAWAATRFGGACNGGRTVSESGMVSAVQEIYTQMDGKCSGEGSCDLDAVLAESYVAHSKAGKLDRAGFESAVAQRAISPGHASRTLYAEGDVVVSHFHYTDADDDTSSHGCAVHKFSGDKVGRSYFYWYEDGGYKKTDAVKEFYEHLDNRHWDKLKDMLPGYWKAVTPTGQSESVEEFEAMFGRLMDKYHPVVQRQYVQQGDVVMSYWHALLSDGVTSSGVSVHMFKPGTDRIEETRFYVGAPPEYRAAVDTFYKAVGAADGGMLTGVVDGASYTATNEQGVMDLAEVKSHLPHWSHMASDASRMYCTTREYVFSHFSTPTGNGQLTGCAVHTLAGTKIGSSRFYSIEPAEIIASTKKFYEGLDSRDVDLVMSTLADGWVATSDRGDINATTFGDFIRRAASRNATQQRPHYRNFTVEGDVVVSHYGWQTTGVGWVYGVGVHNFEGGKIASSVFMNMLPTDELSDVHMMLDVLEGKRGVDTLDLLLAEDYVAHFHDGDMNKAQFKTFWGGLAGQSYQMERHLIAEGFRVVSHWFQKNGTATVNNGAAVHKFRGGPTGPLSESFFYAHTQVPTHVA